MAKRNNEVTGGIKIIGVSPTHSWPYCYKLEKSNSSIHQTFLLRMLHGMLQFE